MFEYRKELHYDCNKDTFNEDIYLRDRGIERWELVSIVKENGTREYYFKRKME
jgi:hypothetical protein